MQPLFIEKTKSTPSISFNNESGILHITGKSLPENAFSFYEPVVNWLETYLKKPLTTTRMIFEIDFFNTATSKFFIYILKLLNKSFHTGNNIVVEWRYATNDLDTLEAGMDFSSFIQIPFIYNELQNN